MMLTLAHEFMFAQKHLMVFSIFKKSPPAENYLIDIIVHIPLNYFKNENLST